MQAGGRADQYLHAGVGLWSGAVCPESDADVPRQGLFHDSVHAWAVFADGLHVAQDEDDSLTESLASGITEVTHGVSVRARLRSKISARFSFGDVMKRIATFMLLLAASSVAWSIPAQAQRISLQENARRSSKAIKKQQKMLNKANKKQAKAMKRAAKAQRKATKKANRRHQR